MCCRCRRTAPAPRLSPSASGPPPSRRWRRSTWGGSTRARASACCATTPAERRAKCEAAQARNRQQELLLLVDGPWVLLTQAGIAFEEIQLKFSDSGKVEGIEPYSPTRQVPVLIVDGEPVWDSLAIGEAVAELFPHKQLWPADPRAGQIGRS